jgi:hypothetical protein
MDDPVFQKLKDDTSFMLSELLRAIAHRPAQNRWQHPSEIPRAPDIAVPERMSPAENGLCYFHLN